MIDQITIYSQTLNSGDDSEDGDIIAFGCHCFGLSRVFITFWRDVTLIATKEGMKNKAPELPR